MIDMSAHRVGIVYDTPLDMVKRLLRIGHPWKQEKEEAPIRLCGYIPERNKRRVKR